MYQIQPQFAYLILTLFSLISYTYGNLNFVSMGNWGAGNTNQAKTADALKEIAKLDHVSFIVSPGSNFLGGVTSVNDTAWVTHFEEMYTDSENELKIPIFTVLGAEDWSSNFTAQIMKTDEIYSNNPNEQNYPKWTTPNWWYHYTTHFTEATGPAIFKTGHKDFTVCFTFIDTWVLSPYFPVYEVTILAWSDLKKTLNVQEQICDFIFVVGDEPIYSSGGSKTNRYLYRHLLPLFKEADIDAYISGNELTMEAFEIDGISYLNCGSASKGSSSLFATSNENAFYSGEVGFCLHEISPDGVKTKFVQSNLGKAIHEYHQPIKYRDSQNKLLSINLAKELPEVKFIQVPNIIEMPGKEIFIKVVGTIGICIAMFFASLAFFATASKVTK